QLAALCLPDRAAARAGRLRPQLLGVELLLGGGEPPQQPTQPAHLVPLPRRVVAFVARPGAFAGVPVRSAGSGPAPPSGGSLVPSPAGASPSGGSTGAVAARVAGRAAAGPAAVGRAVAPVAVAPVAAGTTTVAPGTATAIGAVAARGRPAGALPVGAPG